MEQQIEILLKNIFRYMLFVSSYLPLLIILFLMNIENLYLSSVLGGVMVITLLTLKWYLDEPLKVDPNNRVIIKETNGKSSEALNYIVTYIIPFISFNSSIFSGKDGVIVPTLLAFIILFMVIGSLYMYNNLYYINPVLSLFYDIHTSKKENGENIILISEKERPIPINKTIFTSEVSPGVALYVESSTNRLSYTKIFFFILFLLIFLMIWNEEFQQYASMSLKFIWKVI